MEFIKQITINVSLTDEGEFDHGEVEMLLNAGEYPANTLSRPLSAETFASISRYVSLHCELHAHEEDEDENGTYSKTTWIFPYLELNPEQKEYLAKIDEFMGWFHENKKDMARVFSDPFASGYITAHLSTLQYQVDMFFEWAKVYARLKAMRAQENE